MSGDGELRTIRMQSFPAAWLTLEADTFLKKIQALLLRFGALQEEPIIVDKSGPDGVVVKATYAKGSDALSAKDCLHGVDMRPQAEKQRSAPTEKDKFQVQLVCGEDAKKTQQSTPDVKPGPPFARRALRPGETTYHLRLRGLAAEWTQDMIKELCDQYGAIKRVTADGKGAFVVSFASTDASKSACDCLEGLRLENDGGTCSIIQARLLPERKDGDMEVDEVPLDLLPSALSENGGPIVAYVDELQLAKGEPRPEDREVFLRELPLEDYTEMQLREWLSGFGSVTACHFVRSPQTQELTGCGYVTFASHAEAAGLLAAFPQGSDNDGNVKGSWSLSERMLQGEQGLFKADVVGAISKCIRQTRIDIASAALLFVGGAAEPSPALSDWELGSGPLHFVCSGRHRFSSRGELRDHLADLVSNVLADAFLGKDSGIADMAPTDLGLEAEPTTPCILLHGFPASWAEQQVRLVFSVFGGISSVRFMPAPNNPKSRVALVELKDPSNTVKAVGELDNSQVGDGELIEECTVACKAFGVSSAPSVSFYYVFLDEIVNLSQPQVSPGKGDREVFVQSLPVEDCSEDQIRTWLEGFGPVEDMYLLRDQATNELNGKGYVGYKTHAAACACIQAQASVQDAEDGDVVARWSESERAQQQKESVYGADLCAVAFPQRALDSIRRRVKAKNVWLLGSDRHPPKPRREGQPVPKAVASQFHFVVDCDAEAQVEDIRRELSKMMTDFQRRQDTKAAVPPSVNGVPPPTHQPQNMTPGPATGSSTPWMPFGWRPYGPPPTGWMPPGYAQAPLAPPLAGNGELGSGWGAPTPPTDTPVVPDRSQQETEEGHTSRHRRRKEKNKKEKKAKRRKSQEGEEGKVQEGEEGNVQEGDEVKADVQQEGGVQQKDDPEPPSGTETPPETTKPPPEDADWGTPELQNKDDRARSTSGSRRAKRSRSHDCAKSEDNDKNSTADPGDARDRKRSKSPSNARDQQRSKSRGDARQSSRSRGDAGDRQRSKSRGGGDRQRSKSRGDTRDRERSKSRGDARDRQRSISRGDTRDRQRSKSRGDVRDRHRSKSRGGARDRQRSKSRGDARQRSRSRGDARDRRRSKSRGGARQRSKSRGASRDRQRSKSRDRRDRGRNRSRSRKGRGARGGHRNSDDRSRARRDDSRPRRDDRDRDRR